jgi:hypothetical protein
MGIPATGIEVAKYSKFNWLSFWQVGSFTRWGCQYFSFTLLIAMKWLTLDEQPRTPGLKIISH